jgi:hypothetical protein
LQSRTIFLATDMLRSTAGDLNAYLKSTAKAFPIEPKRITSSPRLRGVGRDERSSHDDRVPDTTDASPHFDGVHIFLDNFVVGGRDRAAWNELADLGLTRVSVGIASGDCETRAHYGQEWPNEALRSTFAKLKSAGIGVSILTLVGAGGTEAANAHVKETAALITSLDMAPGDFVFLLDENELRDPGDLAQLEPLNGEAWQQQLARLKESLAGLKDRKIKVLPYTMEKQGI